MLFYFAGLFFLFFLQSILSFPFCRLFFITGLHYISYAVIHWLFFCSSGGVDGGQKSKRPESGADKLTNSASSAAHKSAAAVAANSSGADEEENPVGRAPLIDDYNDDAAERDESFVLRGGGSDAAALSPSSPSPSAAFFASNAFITHFDDEPPSSGSEEEEPKQETDAIVDYDAASAPRRQAVAASEKNVDKDADYVGGGDSGDSGETTTAGMENILLQLNASSLSLFS
jgi:hypothetical protein